MPMIDVYAAAGMFADKHRLAVDLATAVMTIEKVPDIPMFRKNTAAFVHDLPARRALERGWREHLCSGAGADQRRGPRPRQATGCGQPTDPNHRSGCR